MGTSQITYAKCTSSITYEDKILFQVHKGSIEK